MTTLHQEIDRLLRDAWAPPKELPEHGVDQLLAKAYRTAVDLRLHTSRLDRQYGEAVEPETQRLLDRRFDLLEFVLTTPAEGLRGAQVKLRVLLDPRAGMAAGRGVHDVTAVRDVAAVIGRELVKHCRTQQEEATI